MRNRTLSRRCPALQGVVRHNQIVPQDHTEQGHLQATAQGRPRTGWRQTWQVFMSSLIVLFFVVANVLSIIHHFFSDQGCLTEIKIDAEEK